MNSTFSRRQFLKRTALAGGALSVAQAVSFPNILASENAGHKVRCAQVGCGGRSRQHLDVVKDERLVAIVDPDEKHIAEFKRDIKKREADPDTVKPFDDYRTMFDKIAKEIDAVFVTTPNHHHACVSKIALDLGISVYCEKPLTHYI